MNTHSRLPARNQVAAPDTPPLEEALLDRLGDLLFDTDVLLNMLSTDQAAQMRWVTPHVQHVYDQVNGLMRRLSD